MTKAERKTDKLAAKMRRQARLFAKARAHARAEASERRNPKPRQYAA